MAEGAAATTDGKSSSLGPEIVGALGLRVGLRSLAECCRLVDEGVASLKDVELGMMTGAAIVPGPFSRADEMGLDVVLQALEYSAGEWGEAFTPPVLLKRLVAQGRLGKKTGQGFFPYPQPDSDVEQRAGVQLERRGHVAIAWLNSKPVNSLAPQLVEDIANVWQKVEDDPELRALVFTSANPIVFSAGADLRALGGGAGESGEKAAEAIALVARANEVFRNFERGKTVTIAAVNSMALGGGFELALACDLRIVAESATFALPEIGLGIMPGFGGTQRLLRLAGKGRALDVIMNGDTIDASRAYELGVANDVVADHELFDTALGRAERIANQAAVAISQIKQACDDPSLDAGIAAEQQAFAKALASDDAREGITAFLQKRAPSFTGK